MKVTSELRDATCQWDHTVLAATRQRLPPRLHPNRAGWYSIYRPCKDERLSWLVTYLDGLTVHRRSPILVLTGSDVVHTLYISCINHCANWMLNTQTDHNWSDYKLHFCQFSACHVYSLSCPEFCLDKQTAKEVPSFSRDKVESAVSCYLMQLIPSCQGIYTGNLVNVKWMSNTTRHTYM